MPSAVPGSVDAPAAGLATNAAPTSLTVRSLAPDLARGAMMLLIALANAPWYLWGAENRALSHHPVGASAIDQVLQTIMLVAVDARSYPMFAALFGYGIWQLYSRQMAAGVDRKVARGLLRRRHWWMIAFGGLHAALLWAGDVVGAYGLAGVFLVWVFLDRKDKALRVWAIVLTSLITVAGVFSLIGAYASQAAGVEVEGAGFEVDAGTGEPNYIVSVGIRLMGWLAATPAQAFFTLVIPIAILVGILAARHRVLEEPTRHLPLLRRTAIIGIAVGWLGGAVVAAQNLDLIGLPASFDWAFIYIQSSTGLFAGLGYVALFGLLAARLKERRGKVTWALQAVGKRSLTSYVAQSVIMAPLLSAWGIGLGGNLTTWGVAWVAVGTWLITVAFACWLESTGRRGPLEWALRKLAYKR